MIDTQLFDQQQLEALARLFAILAEPARLAILQRLRAGECAVGVLVNELGIKQANVSKQLGIMYNAGLLQRRRNGSQVIYSIREPMIFELCDLVCRKLHADALRQANAFGAAPP
jgi:ArsR family transcriptional regulator